MSVVEVRSPVEGWDGEVAGVVFRAGVGHCPRSNRAALAYFARHQYQVAPGGEGRGPGPGGVTPAPAPRPAPVRPPMRAPKDAWVAWAVATDLADLAEAQTMTKADLQALGRAELSQERVDPGDSGPDVGAPALGDEQVPDSGQVVDAPDVGAAAGDDLDSGDGIVGQGTRS